MNDVRMFLAAWICMRIVRDSGHWMAQPDGSNAKAYFDGKIAAYLEVLKEVDAGIGARMQHAIVGDFRAAEERARTVQAGA